MLYRLNIAAQLLGLLSVSLLAIPALYVARYGKLLANLRSAAATRDLASEAYDIAASELANMRDSWTPFKGFCLRAGTVSAFLSYSFALVVAICAS